MRRNAQVVSLLALIVDFMAAALPSNSSTASLRANSRNHLHSSQPPVAASGNELHQLLNTTLFPADLSRIDTPMRTARPARRARQNEEVRDDEPAADEPIQRALLPKEGVAQAKRAARHVQRKMELLTGRVNQIQSQIAEDHPTGSGSSGSGNLSSSLSGSSGSNQGQYTSDFSTPYNGDGLDMAADISANQYESNSDKLLDGGSTSAPPAVASIGPDAQNESLSAHTLADGDEYEQRLSGAGNLLRAAANESRWSQQVIKSVVPTILQHQQQQQQQQADEQQGSSTERAMVDTRDPDQQPEEPADGEQSQPKPQEYQTPVTVESDQQVSAAQTPISANRTRLASGLLDNQALPSMVGPDWAPNENHNFFQELNYKNHAKPAVLAESRAEEGVGFPSSQPSQARHSRFQNMTVVSSEQDLANSFSNQQHQVAGGSSSTRRPEQQVVAAAAAPSSSAPKKTSTYSYSVYGRNAKDQQARASTTTAIPAPVDPYDLGYPNDYPTIRSNKSESSASRNYQQSGGQTEPPVVWPTFASSGASGTMPDEGVYSGSRLSSGRDPESAAAAQNEMAPEEKRKYSNLINTSPAASAGDHQLTRAPSSGYQSNEYNYSGGGGGGGGGGARTHRHDSSRDQVRSSGHMLPRDDLLSHSMPGNLSSSSSGGNIGQEGTGLKHRSSSNADESPLMSYSPNQDTSTYSGVGSSAADQYSASGSTSGGYAAADGSADYPASDTPTYQQMRPATGSSSPSYLSASSSSGTQMLGDRNSLFTLPNDLSSAALERALSNYGYQLAGRQPNQDADGSGVTGDPTGGRSSLLPGGAESGSDSGSEQQQQQQQLAQLQQQNYEAQLLQAMRNMNQQQQQQYLSSPTRTSNQIAESMLPAATSTNNRLQRQKQLNQMVNSIVSQQTPASALSSLDINQLLQQFKEQQQQQRLLAAAQQQQQQQQQLQQQVSSSADNQLSFYSGGANQRDSSPNVIYRRYSPEVNYLSTRNSPSSQQQQFMASLATGDSSPGGDFGAFSTASQFQPVYSAAGLEENSRALRNANLAHYRASLAAAKAALSAPYHTGAAAGGAGGTSALANNYNAANQLGQLYATAAVNSPAFYDAPNAAQQSQQQQQVQAQHRLTSSTDSSQQSSAGSAVAGKRSYLNSLFKPTASSRYYYAPTYLSPLSLPSGLHSIYAPAGLTGAETLQTLPQMYATSAASPYLTAGSALDPAAQQYQAFAAANGLQAHYMDPEMAESSMVPTDSGAGGGFSADSSGGGQATSGSIAHSGNSDTETNQSSSKSSKSATPWTNIAGLLLGILPFGILMASLLPAVSVAGRKKRELELSGRNFSELLKWRAPSKVLGALMDLNRQPVEQGRAFGKAAALINGQLAQLVAPQSKRSQQQQQASSSQATSTYSKRRSLARPSQVNPPDDRFASSSGGSNPPSDNLVYSVALNEAANNTASESNSPDPTSSTPPSAHTGNGPANGTGVKAKVRKAISALNNFIAAAQNIKRKHRSSLTDNQWSIPAMLRNSLKLDNLFNINEFRRQMSSVEQTRQLVAEHQLRQLQQQQQQIQQQQQQQQQVQQVQQQQPQQQQQSQSSDTRVEDQTAAPEQPAQPNNQQMEQVLQAPAVVSISVSNDDEPITHTYTATAAELPLLQNREGLTTQVNQSTLAVSVPVNSVAKSGSLLERASELGNSTRNHLALCVNQFLCRLALRLNTVLRNSTTSTSMPSLIDASGKMRANETHALQEQHVEQLTKKYINQVVEQIEAKKVSVPLGLRSAQPGAPEEPLMAPEELNVLYKNAMTNQCRAMYACSELVQFERTLAKMTNLKVGRHLMQPVVAS